MDKLIPVQAAFSNSDKELHLSLLATEQACRLLAEHIPDVVFSLDEGGMINSINQAIARYDYQVDELIGQSIRFLIDADDRDTVTDLLAEAVASRVDASGVLQLRLVAKTGKVQRVDFQYDIRFANQGKFLFMQGICRSAETAHGGQHPFDGALPEFDGQIRSRIEELARSNEELQKELLERQANERALRDREADLELEKANLEETNTALRVLLKRREMDKHEFEEQVMYNVKELILPYLDTLKSLTLDERQEAYLNILESNLNDITKAFSRRLALEFHHLTPSELKVATFIRQGKRSREIASLLGLSLRTIDAYRLSIRRKLRIQNKKVNLRTFLLSIN